MRSKEHKSYGAGTCPICTSNIRVIAIDLTFLQLEHTQDSQKVMCFVVASQSGPAVAVRSAQSSARVRITNQFTVPTHALCAQH